MEGDLIESLSQFLDIGFVGYQLGISSFPFPSQLMDYQRWEVEKLKASADALKAVIAQIEH